MSRGPSAAQDITQARSLRQQRMSVAKSVALRLFRDPDVTVSDIARRAGVDRRTVERWRREWRAES